MSRVVVITGVNGRLGTLMAGCFREAGYTVVGIGRGCEFAADLTAEPETVQVFRKVSQRYGRLYALIHTVGAWRALPVADSTLDDWEAMMSVNLTSTFLCFREAARYMGKPGGRLVAVSSAQGADHGHATQAAYSAAKAGVIRLVEATAKEYQAHGITAHALAPSAIRYRQEGTGGVAAEDVTAAALFVCSSAGAATNGTTLRLYQSRSS